MPRLIPVMLVHGFDGAPSVWTESGFRQQLILKGNLDPNLIRTFDYGIASDGTYNNRGDLREIAGRLAGANLSTEDRFLCSVDQLSDNSVARGGPAEVTLIAHSLGGIICRYYLSRATRDDWGTLYRGNVGRLITIGSPHRGVDLLRLVDLAPRGSLMWRFIRLLEKLGLAPARPATTIERLEAALHAQQVTERDPRSPGLPENRVLLTDSPVYGQLHPDSPVLAELNKPGTMPGHVTCYTVYGDIRYSIIVRANRITLIDHAVSFGDLVVPAESAREIPDTPCTACPFVEGQSIAMTLVTGPALPEPRSLTDALPAVAHHRQLANPEIQAAILLDPGAMKAFSVAWRALAGFYNELFLLIGLSLLWWATGGVFVGLALVLGYLAFSVDAPVWVWIAPIFAIPAGPASMALAAVARRCARDERCGPQRIFRGL